MSFAIERGVSVEEATALAQSIGWEDTPETTGAVLDAVGEGAFAARDGSGALVGMVTCAMWDDLAWIGKMIVAEPARGQGLGRSLLRHALAYAEERGARSVGLDATAKGRPLYEKEGFRAVGESAIWTRAGEKRGPVAPSGEYAIYPVSPAEIMELLACDAPRFGANRAPFLASLVSKHPQQVFVAVHRRTGAFSGHVLSLGGRIGPLVADSPAAAAWLLHAAERAGVPPKVIVAEWNADAVALFEAAGYARVRGCTRMVRGAELPGRPTAIYGIGMWALG